MKELYRRADRYSTLEDNIRAASQTVMISSQNSKPATKEQPEQKGSHFGEISRVYLTHACAGISRNFLVNIEDISVNIGDISVNIGDILVKYHRCIGKILEIYRQYFENIDRTYLDFLNRNLMAQIHSCFDPKVQISSAFLKASKGYMIQSNS